MLDRERILETIDLAERWAERVETYRPARLESHLDEDIPGRSVAVLAIENG